MRKSERHLYEYPEDYKGKRAEDWTEIDFLYQKNQFQIDLIYNAQILKELFTDDWMDDEELLRKHPNWKKVTEEEFYSEETFDLL